MRPLLTFIALSVALPAYAAGSEAIGTATLSDVVELPLYAAGPDDPGFYVEAKVGEERLLLRLVTEHGKLLLTEAAGKRVGASWKGKDDPATGGWDDRHAMLDAVALGGAQLSDVRAMVYGSRATDVGVDGEIGLAGFPDLAWAFLPDQGIAKIAPVAQGGEVLTWVRGQAVPFTSTEARKVKAGASKVPLDGAPYVVGVRWSGVEVPARLVLGGDSRLAREVEGGTSWRYRSDAPPVVKLPVAPGRVAGEARMEWREVEVGGVTRWVDVRRFGQGVTHYADVNADLGVDALAFTAFAVDPASHMIALLPAEAPKRTPYADTWLASVKAELDAAADDDARKGAESAWADALLATGRLQDALPLLQKRAADPEASCADWLAVGEVGATVGMWSEAVDALGRADALYAPWAALPLDERQEAQADKAKADKKEEAWQGPVPQPHACHVAAGRLAAVRVQMNDLAAVATLYPSRMDLDPGLPMAAGAAALLAGQPDAAQAAFRQAERLDGAAVNPDARVGLWLALARSNPALAPAQLEAAGQADNSVVLAKALALEADGGTALLGRLLAQNPGDPLLLAAQARTGDAAAVAAAEAAFRARTALYPTNATWLAEYARFLLGAGKLAEARGAAQAALALAPTDGFAWLVMSEIEGQGGDAARAADARKRAEQAWFDRPALVALLRL